MKLYVDDIRDCPTGYDCARNYSVAIKMLEDNEYDEVSLDHDIASFTKGREYTGYDIVKWLVERKMDGKFVPNTIKVHSANPVGRKVMEETIKQWL